MITLNHSQAQGDSAGCVLVLYGDTDRTLAGGSDICFRGDPTRRVVSSSGSRLQRVQARRVLRLAERERCGFQELGEDKGLFG